MHKQQKNSNENKRQLFTNFTYIYGPLAKLIKKIREKKKQKLLICAMKEAQSQVLLLELWMRSAAYPPKNKHLT